LSQTSFVTVSDGSRIAYRFDGSTDRPVLLLSNSIGTTLHMWDLQISALIKHYRVLRYDSRGHGASDVPEGEYSLDRLGADVIDLLNNLEIKQVDFCGLSLGGIVGQWLAFRAPDRINRLVLCNTSAYLGPSDQWTENISTVLRDDIERNAATFLGNWFLAQMISRNGPAVQQVRAMLMAMNPQGFAGSFAAVRDMDMRHSDTLISCQTLVIAGQFDTVTLASHSELIAQAIPGAKLVVLPAVHLTNIELPTEFICVLFEFLLGVPRPE
jgi:3-oxoadipate enol-lactonase